MDNQVEIVTSRTPITIIEVYRGGNGSSSATVERLTTDEVLSIMQESGILKGTE